MFAAVRRVWRASLLATAMAGALAGATQAGTITAYSALEEDEIAAYLAAAKTAIPDVTVKVLRLSTGDLSARVIAEAANPQADVVWGVAVTNLLDPRIQGQLEAYVPKGADKLSSTARAADGKWVAPTGYMAAFCVNTERLKAKGLPMPKDWADLADPRFKGEIVMPNPVSSGTGYLQVAGILQQRGADAGWKLLNDINANVAQYIKSGSRPCKMARAGEFAVGTSLAFAAIQSIKEGFPLAMVIPSSGAGYELEGSGLVKGSKNADDARKFLDWTVSPSALSSYGGFKEIVPVAGFKPDPSFVKAGLPEDVLSVLVKMDFPKSAQERPAVLERWQKDIGR